ncbi:hypothetical protein DFR68_113104 [Nocardia mexicana]|uniref:Uncharacterized protein n=1 Tax=Nocardia mexicana TaxID=279262 RepID=A0A370GTT5_9NOCA|nr:hypothetical protein DFR68_113104 [Nocardia mexicana]
MRYDGGEFHSAHMQLLTRTTWVAAQAGHCLGFDPGSDASILDSGRHYTIEFTVHIDGRRRAFIDHSRTEWIMASA